ncbi:MAG: folylpolyglutamate synthase/dihydrofolate synthase family protein [Prevotella sp.]|nr:folylpolyglutamate synthase/dihydrofolate synthase family protein [Prevotella sp.]
MNYKETCEFLFSQLPMFERQGSSGYKPGLQTTEALDAHYGHPHRRYPTIHVAGTNGKGSVSHALARILQDAGLRVGLYTSPHLVDFRERIRVNGEYISEQYVVDFVESLTPNPSPKGEGSLHPSFFELTTAMAFKYFADEQVDVAVIEVGLGGRLDSTNIITPMLSVITNIALDHTQFLGSTLAEIASEKAGIIKQGVPVVIGEATSETRPVFEQKASEMNAPIFFAEEFEMPSPLPDFELKGAYQQKNLRTILCAVAQIKNLQLKIKNSISQPNILPSLLGEGSGERPSIQNLGLMGRWQTLQTQPLVICDTGHNPAAWEYLAPQIAAQKCHQLRIVFGMVDDKDLNAVLAMLPKNAVYYFTQAESHRAIPADRVAEKAAAHNLHGGTYPTVAEAYHQALADAAPDDFIFVGGSSYIVADLLSNNYLETK